MTGAANAVAPAVLEARGVVRRFGGLTAVDGVDMAVRAGEVSALIGPNGAGKSTLFGCLAGQLPVDGGRVLLDGRDVTRLSADARARRGLARTFQRLAVFPTLTVRENVRVGAENRRHRGLFGRGHQEDDGEIPGLLGALGLSALADTVAGDLPTGTLRLVELATALAARPRVVLLDEPSSGLDDDQAERLAALLRDMATRGRAVLLVEHDLSLVFGTADVVHVLAGGAIIASGTPAQITTDHAVRAAYLGSVR